MSDRRRMRWMGISLVLVLIVLSGLLLARHRARHAARTTPFSTPTTGLSEQLDGTVPAGKRPRAQIVRPLASRAQSFNGVTLERQEDAIELAPGNDGEPPLLAYAGVSRDIDAQLIGILARAATLDRSTALQSGRQLLDCTNEVLRALGAAILCQHDGLTQEVIAQLVKDADPVVPLTALGWLGDIGHIAEAEQLLAAWKAGGVSGDILDHLAASLEDGALGSVGGRAALRLLKEMYTAEQFRTVLDAMVKGREAVPYSLRLSALWTGQSLVDVGTFQDQLRELSQQSSLATGGALPPRAAARNSPFSPRRTATPKRQPMDLQGPSAGKLDTEESLWQQGLSRLVSRFDGPAEIVQNQPTLCPQYVDEFFARRDPVMLEALAVWVEAATADPSASIARGSASSIASHLGTLSPSALSAEQKYAVIRIQSRLGNLTTMERDLPPVGPSSPPE